MICLTQLQTTLMLFFQFLVSFLPQMSDQTINLPKLIFRPESANGKKLRCEAFLFKFQLYATSSFLSIRFCNRRVSHFWQHKYKYGLNNVNSVSKVGRKEKKNETQIGWNEKQIWNYFEMKRR